MTLLGSETMALMVEYTDFVIAGILSVGVFFSFIVQHEVKRNKFIFLWFSGGVILSPILVHFHVYDNWYSIYAILFFIGVAGVFNIKIGKFTDADIALMAIFAFGILRNVIRQIAEGHSDSSILFTIYQTSGLFLDLLTLLIVSVPPISITLRKVAEAIYNGFFINLFYWFAVNNRDSHDCYSLEK